MNGTSLAETRSNPVLTPATFNEEINKAPLQHNEPFDQERYALLSFISFGAEVTAVTSKSGLEDAIDRGLKVPSIVANYIITIMDEESATSRLFLYDKAAAFVQGTEFPGMVTGKYDLSDEITQQVLLSEDPVLIKTNDRDVLKYSPANLFFSKKHKPAKLAGMALRAGKQNIGILWFEPGPINPYFLKTIASPLAKALLNVLTDKNHLSEDIKPGNKMRPANEINIVSLQQSNEAGRQISEMIGTSIAMQKVYRLISHVACSNSTVLVLGETGTGKELIAKAIHNHSPRSGKPIVKVNCATLPVNLIESELFGHERGSFTGATDRRIGKFEMANHGTLFLDEVGEMPLDLQVKLLRAIQEREIERVGGKITIKVDVRIVAATNRDLQKEVKEGRFRSDLYYRLNVFPISLPPLRYRKDDIPALSEYFITKYAKITAKHITGISKKAINDLISYDWPGNIRELEHLIERSILLSNGNILTEIQLPGIGENEMMDQHHAGCVKTFDENERDYILTILRKCNGKISGQYGAAKLLSIPPSTLTSKMRKLAITKDQIFIR